MRDETKKKLIEIYERKRGRKGSFMHLLAHYHETILRLNNEEGYTAYMITSYIEEDLNYSFQCGDKNPFYRALNTYINSKIKAANELKKPIMRKPIGGGPRENLVLTRNEKTGSFDTEQRSDLITGNNPDEEVKELFKGKK